MRSLGVLAVSQRSMNYTTHSREFAARFAAKMNLTQPNSGFSTHEIEELAPGYWRVARVYRRSDNNQWDRESVSLPNDDSE